MTYKPNDEMERKRTDEAWARLDDRLRHEEPSPVWAEWDRRADEVKRAAAGSREALLRQAAAERAAEADGQRNSRVIPAATTEQTEAPRKRRRKLSGRVAGAAAAALLAAVVMTPSANQALASFLNQFRMEQVVVVNEGDLRTLLETLGGEAGETANTFGTFTRTSDGEYRRGLTEEEAEQSTGLTFPSITGHESGQVEFNTAPAQTLTLQLNVDAVNGAMEKLGATKLLPDTVDGKPISLRTGVQLLASYREADSRSFWMNRMAVPTIEVDPSIDVQDAFETFLRFPGLPHDFRQAVVGSTGLEDGKLPIPVFSDGRVEQRIVSGATVFVERSERSVNAKWVKDGVMNELGAWNYSDADFDALLTEMVGG